MQGSQLRGSLDMRVVASAAALVIAVCAGDAWSQDYALSTAGTSQFTATPSNATSVNVGDDTLTELALPFEFPYFGQVFPNVHIGSNGYVQFIPAGATVPTPPGVNGGVNNWDNESFPFASDPFYDGIVAPLWVDLSPSRQGSVKHFTTGTTPNRKFIVAWDNVPCYGDGGAPERGAYYF